MSPAQEQSLREEVHSWRRPGDPFIYDLVVVGSGVEAAVAMRLNANIQACVIRRRFAHAAYAISPNSPTCRRNAGGRSRGPLPR